jgi:hypothetical protein
VGAVSIEPPWAVLLPAFLRRWEIAVQVAPLPRTIMRGDDVVNGLANDAGNAVRMR